MIYYALSLSIVFEVSRQKPRNDGVGTDYRFQRQSFSSARSHSCFFPYSGGPSRSTGAPASCFSMYRRSSSVFFTTGSGWGCSAAHFRVFSHMRRTSSPASLASSSLMRQTSSRIGFGFIPMILPSIPEACKPWVIPIRSGSIPAPAAAESGRLRDAGALLGVEAILSGVAANKSRVAGPLSRVVGPLSRVAGNMWRLVGNFLRVVPDPSGVVPWQPAISGDPQDATRQWLVP